MTNEEILKALIREKNIIDSNIAIETYPTDNSTNASFYTTTQMKIISKCFLYVIAYYEYLIKKEK